MRLLECRNPSLPGFRCGVIHRLCPPPPPPPPPRASMRDCRVDLDSYCGVPGAVGGREYVASGYGQQPVPPPQMPYGRYFLGPNREVVSPAVQAHDIPIHHRAAYNPSYQDFQRSVNHHAPGFSVVHQIFTTAPPPPPPPPPPPLPDNGAAGYSSLEGGCRHSRYCCIECLGDHAVKVAYKAVLQSMDRATRIDYLTGRCPKSVGDWVEKSCQRTVDEMMSDPKRKLPPSSTSLHEGYRIVLLS